MTRRNADAPRGYRVGRHRIPAERLDKVLIADGNLTKRDLIEHYLRVADRMLPLVADRPLVLQRFPDGLAGDGFYQKHIPDHYPEWIDRVTVAKAGGQLTHVVASNAATLAFLADQAAITLHAWLSRRDRLDHPDRLIFDLDPPDGDFALVRAAAHRLRDLLDELGLWSVPMTTGSRGLHVVVPLDRGSDFATVRRFARDVAETLVRRDPRLTTAVRTAARQGRLFVDYLRNGWAQTAVAPYAVRARPGAPVATPLDWDEVGDRRLTSDRWTVASIASRLADPDPWRGIGRRGRGLGRPRERLAALHAAE